MIALLEDKFITAAQLKTRYSKLTVDATFEKYLRGSTTDTLIVKERYKKS